MPHPKGADELISLLKQKEVDILNQQQIEQLIQQSKLI